MTPLTKAALDRYEVLARDSRATCERLFGEGVSRDDAELSMVPSLCDATTATIAALREAVEMLRKIESAAIDGCGVCKYDYAHNGHLPDCALSKLLARYA